MNNQIQIDLSKAYEGQTVNMRGGDSFIIKDITIIEKPLSPTRYELISSYDNHVYYQNGKMFESGEHYSDIIAIEDPIQVQAARIEGEIKGITETLKNVAYSEWQEIDNRKAALIEQLKALQDGN